MEAKGIEPSVQSAKPSPGNHSRPHERGEALLPEGFCLYGDLLWLFVTFLKRNSVIEQLLEGVHPKRSLIFGPTVGVLL